MAAYTRDFLTSRHKHYEEKFNDWNFHLMSYLGGQDYQNAYQLNRYILETDEEYLKRAENTPIDNHCKNVVQIYSSFLFRVPPTRDYGSLSGDWRELQIIHIRLVSPDAFCSFSLIGVYLP